jgi:hypothetical protein
MSKRRANNKPQKHVRKNVTQKQGSALGENEGGGGLWHYRQNGLAATQTARKWVKQRKNKMHLTGVQEIRKQHNKRYTLYGVPSTFKHILLYYKDGNHNSQ